MAKLSNEELLDAFKEMTLVELSEFVKAFEDEFDVKAAAPAAAVVAAAPAAGDSAEEEKTEFDVVLTSAGDKKIQVIKAVKAITNLGLADAKKQGRRREGQEAARRGWRHRRAQVMIAA